MAAPQVPVQVVAAHSVNSAQPGNTLPDCISTEQSCKLSIIIPCLNEAEQIENCLRPMQSLRERGHEIIVCDAGSTDNTRQLAGPLCDIVLQADKGRALQMNAGATLANGDVLCFLHADTLSPQQLDEHIFHALQQSHSVWGRFNIRLSGQHPAFRLIERMINLRSCLSGIASGDQGIFIYRSVFNRLGGYKAIALMEDIELSKRLRKISKPACIKQITLTTSSRRWEEHGITRTVLLMWKLRLKYFLGSQPQQLASEYRDHS
jgi:rSAM/selenodomain-associated transferase 2